MAVSTHRPRKSLHDQRRGATAILFAFVLVVVIAIVAFAIDLGYVASVRTDLQSAADSGALAGAGRLLEGHDVAVETAQLFTGKNINNRGVNSGTHNQIAVETGHWDPKKHKFKPNEKPNDAIKVIATVSEVSLFFGRTAGTSKTKSEATAIASFRARDIMLVLDVSGSMNEASNGIRKIDELKQAAQSFIGFLRNADGGDRVGFSYYSTKAKMGKELTDDLDAVEKELNDHLTPGGWTNISDGMKLAREELMDHRRSEAVPMMLVLTDGAANTIQPEDIQDVPQAKLRVHEEAEAAQRAKIPIFTIALDSHTAQVDVELMREVAETTKSDSFHVIAGEVDTDGNRQLQEAFRKIALIRPLRLVD